MDKEIKNAVTDALKEKGLLEKAKSFLAKLSAQAKPVDIKLSQTAQLQDGTTVSYDADKLDIGVPVMVAGPDGNPMPAPDGDIVMQDGTVVTIDDGKVMAIVPAVATPPPAAQPPMSTEQMATAFSELKASFEAQKKTITSLTTEVSSLKKQHAESLDMLKVSFEAIDTISKVPAAKSPVPIKAWDDMNAYEKRQVNKEK